MSNIYYTVKFKRYTYGKSPNMWEETKIFDNINDAILFNAALIKAKITRDETELAEMGYGWDFGYFYSVDGIWEVKETYIIAGIKNG